MTFFSFIRHNYRARPTPQGRVFNLMRLDPTFPRRATTRSAVLGYLNGNNVAPEIVQAFQTALDEYERWRETGDPKTVDYSDAWRGYARYHHGPELISLTRAEGPDCLEECWDALAAHAPLQQDDPRSIASWHTLDRATKAQLLRSVWCLEPTAGPRTFEGHTSRTLREHFRQAGLAVTDGQVKAALLLCGFAPKEVAAPSWRLRVASTSPALSPAAPTHTSAQLSPQVQEILQHMAGYTFA